MAGHMMLQPSTMSQHADNDTVDMHGLILQRLWQKYEGTRLCESLFIPNLHEGSNFVITALASVLFAHLFLNSI